MQNRILPISATINGITVINDSTSVPLFTALPSYALFNMRGGFTLNENSKIFVAFENIFDNFYRHPSWGVDGAGRSLLLHYRYKF
ncbi:MAG: hypothetical protein ABI686_00825 [Acidobacteriota bacterium]